MKPRGIVDAWSNVKFFGIYKTRQGEFKMTHIDDERKTDFGNQRHVYEDVILERAPVIPEQTLEDAVVDFSLAQNALAAFA